MIEMTGTRQICFSFQSIFTRERNKWNHVVTAHTDCALQQNKRTMYILPHVLRRCCTQTSRVAAATYELPTYIAHGSAREPLQETDIIKFQTVRGGLIISISCTGFFLSIISELYCNKLRLKSHLLQVRAPAFGGKKKVDLRTLNGCSAATEASMSTGNNEVKSCPIPTRVLTLKDWSQLPDCYSQTPGGTLFSTTPGGNNNNLCVEMSL